MDNNPLVRGAVFIGAFASLLVSAAIKEEIAAYVLLVWALLLFFRIHKQEVLSLWLLYGFAYWSLGVGKNDSNILLTLVRSCVFVPLISLANIRKRRHLLMQQR